MSQKPSTLPNKDRLISRIYAGDADTFQETWTASVHGGEVASVVPLSHPSEHQSVSKVGVSAVSRVLAVSHMERGDVIRIISARPATRMERKMYEED